MEQFAALIGIGVALSPTAEKRAALDRAKNLLDKSEDGVLPYVALELRRCLEAVVYEKLAAYRNRLPDRVARMWQPPQAFKALAQLEPGAQHTSTLSIAPESEPGVPSGPFMYLGQDLRPDPVWLTETWNKLGSFLHASFPFARKNKSNDSKAREFFLQVAQELKPFVENSFTSTLAQVVSVVFVECRNDIIANADGAVARGFITCLNPQCNARYQVRAGDDEMHFLLYASSVTCMDCKTVIKVPDNRMRVGYEFKCPSCQAQYHLVSQVWEYNRTPKP